MRQLCASNCPATARSIRAGRLVPPCSCTEAQNSQKCSHDRALGAAGCSLWADAEGAIWAVSAAVCFAGACAVGHCSAGSAFVSVCWQVWVFACSVQWLVAVCPAAACTPAFVGKEPAEAALTAACVGATGAGLGVGAAGALGRAGLAAPLGCTGLLLFAKSPTCSSGNRRGNSARCKSSNSSAAAGSGLCVMRRWASSTICHAA